MRALLVVLLILASASKLGAQAARAAPTLFELMDQYKSKTPEVMRAVTRIVLASGEFGRPMVTGPGNPPDRVKSLRESYANAMRDPGMIEEARRGQMEMESKELMNQPRDVTERVKKILTE